MKVEQQLHEEEGIENPWATGGSCSKAIQELVEF
jgi:hypothetical protein